MNGFVDGYIWECFCKACFDYCKKRDPYYLKKCIQQLTESKRGIGSFGCSMLRLFFFVLFVYVDRSK